MKPLLLALTSLLGLQAGPILLNGSFSSDDQITSFLVKLNSSSTVTIRSLGYGGDLTNSVAAGGFDTVLSIFNSTGLLLALNNDAGCPPASPDPVSGACWDAALSTALGAGEYLVVLSQYENTPIGPYLSDGFSRIGEGNYTSVITGIPGGPFLDANGNPRTGNWAILFDGAASVTETPEPASLLLLASSSAVLLAGRRVPSKRAARI